MKLSFLFIYFIISSFIFSPSSYFNLFFLIFRRAYPFSNPMYVYKKCIVDYMLCSCLNRNFSRIGTCSTTSQYICNLINSSQFCTRRNTGSSVHYTDKRQSGDTPQISLKNINSYCTWSVSDLIEYVQSKLFLCSNGVSASGMETHGQEIFPDQEQLKTRWKLPLLRRYIIKMTPSII